MPRKKVTWVMIGDGAKAQLYNVVSVIPMRIKAIQGGRFRGVRAKNTALESDRPGRSFDRVGGGRHAIQPRSDAHRRQEDRFVGRVTAAINAAAEAKKFDQIIVVAPPRALAAFRRKCQVVAHAKVRREIRGDWTKLNPAEIQEHLVAHLAE